MGFKRPMDSKKKTLLSYLASKFESQDCNPKAYGLFGTLAELLVYNEERNMKAGWVEMKTNCRVRREPLSTTCVLSFFDN